MKTNEHAVVIAGGGPTGLMLAGELALAGVDVAIVERRDNHDLAGLRAGGLHSRTIEVLDQRGIADRFLSQGQKIQRAPFVGTTADISDLPSRHNYYLALWQTRIERILADWVGEFAVPVYRGQELTDFAQDDTGVDVTLSSGPSFSNGLSLRAKYLVGCDGGRSLIRKKAGIDFPGWDATASWLIAEVELAQEPELGIRRNERGINAMARIDDGKCVRVVVNEEYLPQRDEPTLRDIREALTALYGTDFGLRSATNISRFTDMARQAASYRRGRVLLAGDAAHVHPPMGGQGLNIGVQDAVNLGWKLAQVVHGTSPESLLDTYHAERHRVGARVLRNTMALSAIDRSDDRIGALREMLHELAQKDELRRQYFAMMSGLDVHYDFGPAGGPPSIEKPHPLLGRRMPDLELVTASGSLRVFTLLHGVPPHGARPVLLNFGGLGGGELGSFDIAPWASRVQLVNAKYGAKYSDAKYDHSWELPALGAVAAPSAVLIRPDGYVAWVGDRNQQEGTKPKSQPKLTEALTTWFGSPTAVSLAERSTDSQPE